MVHALLLFSLAAGAAVTVLLAVNLGAMPRLSLAARPPPARWLSVSVVIPARDEERDLEAAVRSHLAQDYPDLEVIVVDDRSTDATPRILERLAGEDARLRVVSGSDPPPDWLGKPHALHLGAAQARGDLLLFADADVLYDRRTLRESVTLLEVERLDFLCLLPRFVMRGFWENVLLPNILLSYFFGPAILANSDWFRWFAAGGGAGNLVRRDGYDAIGGHAAIRCSVIDDVRLAFRAKQAGLRCRAVRAEDRISVRMYHGFREVCDGFTKNVAYLYQGWIGVLVLLLSLASIVPAVLPTAVLLAAVLGAPVSSADVGLSALGFAMAIVARGAMALALREPLWAAVTNPLMVAVWTGIIGRSLYWKLVRKEVRWRGRRYDAARASF